MRELTVITSQPCPRCKTVKTYSVLKKQYDRWLKGAYVSKAFPHLTQMECESLISGVCSDECWDAIFRPYDE